MMHTSAVPPRLRCQYTDLRTPRDVVNAVTDLFEGEIVLDPFSDPTRWTRASFNYHRNGERLGWFDRTYANPPYGQMIPRAVAHAAAQASVGHRIAVLLPCGARFSTRYFQDHVLSTSLTAVVFFNKRLKFLDPDDRPRTLMYDSALWVYNTRAARVVEAFRPFGRILKTEVL